MEKEPLFDRIEDIWYSGIGRIIKWGAIAAIGFSLVCGANKLNNLITEDSSYQGQITSFGRSGLIWKTYEGTFAIGGENRSETGYFSLDEEARNGENIEKLANQLYKAVETKANVKVHGTKPAICWPWRSSNNYHIDRVEFLEE